MAGLLFVTAPSADHKVINRLLLHLRDWEYGAGDCFRLVTTKNAYDLEPAPGETSTEETVPPVSSDVSNAWSDASLPDVEAFTIDLARFRNQGISNELYLLLDDKGLQDQTIIVGERQSDDDDEALDTFSKARVPWDEAYIAWCNLDIANMSFEDYCDEDEGQDQDGWMEYRTREFDDLSDENRARRDEAIRELEQNGQA